MGGVVTEEQAISRAQYLDLVHYQSGTLYELIPNDPKPTNDPSRLALEPHADVLIGSVERQSSSSSIRTKSSFAYTPTSTLTVSKSKSNCSLVQTFEVNVVNSSSSQKFGGKKNITPAKGKNKHASKQHETTQTQEPIVEPKPKQKAKFPCMICGDDHYTKECPHKDQVTKFLKGNSQPAVLTDPFPP